VCPAGQIVAAGCQVLSIGLIFVDDPRDGKEHSPPPSQLPTLGAQIRCRDQPGCRSCAQLTAALRFAVDRSYTQVGHGLAMFIITFASVTFTTQCVKSATTWSGVRSSSSDLPRPPMRRCRSTPLTRSAGPLSGIAGP
jgi:hypothetical protein